MVSFVQSTLRADEIRWNISALAFRLSDKKSLRVRAPTLISTVGSVGRAVWPTVGGFILDALERGLTWPT